MEVKPYNIAVSISFPPDTDTPQLQAELPQRSAIVAELASYGSVFQAGQVARDVWRGVERGRFQITHGFDGFLMGTVTAGMAPVGSMWEGLVQVSFVHHAIMLPMKIKVGLCACQLCLTQNVLPLGCDNGCVSSSGPGLPGPIQQGSQ